MLSGATTDGPLRSVARADRALSALRERALDHTRDAMGPDRYQAAYAMGARLSYNDPLDYLLERIANLIARS